MEGTNNFLKLLTNNGYVYVMSVIYIIRDSRNTKRLRTIVHNGICNPSSRVTTIESLQEVECVFVYR